MDGANNTVDIVSNKNSLILGSEEDKITIVKRKR